MSRNYDRFDLMYDLNRLLCRIIGHTKGATCARCCKPGENT